MRNSIYFMAALFLSGMSIPQAQAASILFTLSSGGTYSGSDSILTYTSGGFTLVLTGYSCPATLCISNPTETDTRTALDQSTGGLGMANDRSGSVYQVPRNEFIQVDFSTIAANSHITSVQFNMTNVVDGWDIYTSALPAVFDSGSGSPIAQGNNQAGYTLTQFPDLNSTIARNAATGSSLITSSSLGYYSISALQADCETVLSQITVSYITNPVPEPGTCLVVGLVLLGLGMARRKAR